MSVRSELRKAFREGDPAAAVKHLAAARDASPDDPRNALLLADGLSEVGRYDEAEPLFREVIDARPHLAAGHALYARSLYDQGRLDDAMDRTRAALAIEKDHALARVVRGLALVARGIRYAGAEELDAVGSADDPDLAGRLLLAIESSGKLDGFYHPPIPEDAEVGSIPPPPIETGETTGEPEPDRWEEFTLRRAFYAGLALRREYRMGDALRKWHAVLRAVPGEPDALVEMAATYYLVGDFAAALATLSRLAENTEADADARAVRGLALYASGRTDEARPLVLEAIGEAVDVEATDEPVDLAAAGMAFYYAGLIALADGDRVLARQRFARVPALDPLCVHTRWEAFKRR